MMDSIIKEPWFSRQATALGVLKLLRDTYRNHPERYVEDTISDGEGRHCALGMILVAATCDPSWAATDATGIADQANKLLAAELPATNAEYIALREKRRAEGTLRHGTARGYDGMRERIATCSNLFGPEFIADACDRAIAKLEPKPKAAFKANFVKPRVEEREMVMA